MQTYLIKRFLLMIPTIFGISLVVFTVINLAPGEPAAMSATGGDTGKALSSDQAASAESYQIFKKQFNLDKPLLLNFRPWLETETVEREVRDWLLGSDKERIAAYGTLTDWGKDAVPHLVSILERKRKEAPRLEGEDRKRNTSLQAAILRLLSLNTLTDVEEVDSAEGEELTGAQEDTINLNKAIQVENNRLRERALPEDKETTEEQIEAVGRLWIAWFRGRKALGDLPPQRAGTEDIQAAFGKARQDGEIRSLRSAGKTTGKQRGAAGIEALVDWVSSMPLEDLFEATMFAVPALDAMLPRKQDPLPVERTEHRSLLKALRAGAGKEWRDVRLERLRERWTLWWGGREARFERATPEKISTLLFETRFAQYWYNLVRLDFGESLQYKDKKVIDLILKRLKVSITFALSSFLLAYLISIPIGVFSAVYKDSVADRVVTLILFALYSLPNFFTAVLLQRYLTIGDPFNLFPTTGFESAGAQNIPFFDYVLDVGWHMILPVFCLSYMSFATLSRYMRSGLLDVIRSDYIRTARAKGLSEWVIIFKHALRNGLIPILTLVGGILPVLMGGSVILEKIFNIPGMGLLMLDAIFQRDYNIVMADSLIVGLLVLCGLLLSDILYVLVDPRISFE